MKLVLIEWEDSYTRPDPGWKNLDDIRDDARTLVIRSVGWIVHETKQSITVLPHMYQGDCGLVPNGLGEITIPKRCIVRRRKLKAKLA